MNIFIITMDDPVLTKSFISKIIENRYNDIVGLAVAKGDRLTIQKNKSRIEYLFSLLLIMGLPYFLKYSLISLVFKIRIKVNKIFPYFFNSPSVLTVAEKKGIKTWKINSPNNKKFLEEIKNINIDVIIHQSQNIIKSELLSIPKIGVINRHNALLPKNKGRLTPFWVLYKEEKETGVSIHFVTEKLDSGDIIIQEKFPISTNDNFNSVVKKNYEIAPKAMLKALDKLENGDKTYIKNDASFGTYNSTPNLMEAFDYRRKRIMKKLFN